MVKFPYFSPSSIEIKHVEEVIRVLAAQEPGVVLVKNPNRKEWFLQVDNHSAFWRMDFIRELIKGIDLGVEEMSHDRADRGSRPEARIVQS